MVVFSLVCLSAAGASGDGLSLVPVASGSRILPEDAREYARQIQALPDTEKGRLLPRALLAGLQRFRATRSIQGASKVASEVCEAESDRLDSELAMIRDMHARLAAWADDLRIKHVVIRAAGERAFCAGGDIRQLHQWGLAGDPRAIAFYREEYRLNAFIKHYPKPYLTCQFLSWLLL